MLASSVGPSWHARVCIELTVHPSLLSVVPVFLCAEPYSAARVALHEARRLHACLPLMAQASNQGHTRSNGLGRGGRCRHGCPLARIGDFSRKMPIRALLLRPRGLGEPPRIEGWVYKSLRFLYTLKALFLMLVLTVGHSFRDLGSVERQTNNKQCESCK